MKQYFNKAFGPILIFTVVSMLMTLAGTAWFHNQKAALQLPFLSDSSYKGYISNNGKKTLTYLQVIPLIQDRQKKEGCFGFYFFNANGYAIWYSSPEKFQVELKSGRLFDKKDFRERTNTALIYEGNEKKCRKLQGYYYVTLDQKKYRVVGVLKNHHYSNEPDFYINMYSRQFVSQNCSGSWFYDGGGSEKQVLDKIKNQLEKSYPQINFQYAQSGTKGASQFYSSTTGFSAMFLLLVLTVFLVLLNIFSVCDQWMETRKKEIALRRLVGASKMAVRRWVARQFLLLAAISFAASTAASIIALKLAALAPAGNTALMLFGTFISWQAAIGAGVFLVLLSQMMAGVLVYFYRNGEIAGVIQ